MSKEERRRRREERERAQRRAAGVEDRYAKAASHRTQAYRLHVQGLATKEIADALNISQRRVQQLLREEAK